MSEASINRLKSKTTLGEILEVATEFERTARDFYADLAPKVRKNIRWLVQELAEEEQRHYDLFTELAARDDIGGQLKVEIERPVSDHKFSDCIQLPDLGEQPDDQAVLQYALMREHAAMEQYHSLAQSTEPGPIHDLFLFLANEETKHKNELEKVYYEIVHSGGV
ncbi:MAG: ferritin family protein [Thiothrix litoralis]|jgi:rubrerythrin|uniref:ferritin family protein n=1 Tax=Thiothrix litoralis TaxID=2891210 RepID=UPI003C76D9A9